VRAVYVYGAPWSGTTILYRFLAFHPHVAWLSQYSQRNGRVPARRRLPLAHAADRALRAVRPHDWQKDAGVIGRIVPRPVEAPSIMEYYVRVAPTRSEAAARLRLVAEEECRRWGRSVFLAKPLQLYGRLDVLEEAHPDTRILHIVRDGRAVAPSIRRKFMKRGETPAEGLEGAAAHWMNVIDEVNELGLPTLTLRYEDLCAATHSAIRRALGHAGLDPEAFPFERVPSNLKVTNDRRLAQLGPDELEAIQRAQGPHLRTLGYLDA
jgi:omega-hydroxy-beta-dihydromenaquinone-9 sulfotransferase